MPALKLLLRRTIATTTALNPHPPSPSPLLSSPSMTAHSLPATVYCIGGGVRSTLAKKGGACTKHTGAHVKDLTTKIKPMIIGNHNININRKRVFMLSSSSSPISSSSSSSSAEERESSSEGQGMGQENNNRNDGTWLSNGAVLPPNDKDQKKGKKEEHCYDTKLLTLPTVLTLARVAAIPVFIGTFYVNSWWGAAATTSLFVAAAITDWLDGYLARRMCLGTAFGAFLDPVADKLMVAATLVLLCSRPPEIAVFGDIPWLFPVPAIAIIGREITMSAVREWAASQDAKLLQAVAVNNLGKWKTATQMTALTIILATRDSSVVASQGALATSGVALLYVSAGLAVWSLVVYMKKIWKVLMR